MNEDNNTNPPKKGFTLSPKVLNDFKTGNTAANSPFGYRANETYLNGFTGENMDYLTGYEDYTNYNGKNYTGLYNTIEGLRGENQSTSNKLVKGVGRLTTRALGEIAKIPGYAGGLIGAAFAEDGEGWDTAFNNFWVRGVEDAIGYVNENALDVHNNDDYKNLGLLGKLATADFWATEGADGVGYLLAMMAPGAALSRLKLGNSLLRNTTTASSLGNKERQLSTLEGLSSLGVNADRVDSALITVANTYMEAGSEAGNAMRTFEESKPKFIEQHTSEKILDLKRDFAAGNISEEAYITRQNQIMADAETAFNQQKGRLGRDIFFANAAILLGPNAIQTNILFGKGASKYITEAAKPKTYQSALKGLGIGIFSEGFFEEGMQSTVEGIFSKKAEDNQLTTNILNDFTVGDIMEGYADTLTSVEGQSAIFLGGLLGGTMNMVGQIRSDRNDYKVSQAIATKFGTLPGDMLKTVNSLYKKDKDGNIVLGRNNKPQLDLKGAKLAAYRHLGSETMNQIQDNALLENDEDLVKYIKETYASDLGMSFGLLDNNEQVRNASGEALNQYLEDQITAIQENPKLDEATKEVMIKDARETAAIARKMYAKTIQMNDALQVLQGSISPELDSKFVGPSAEEAKRTFLTAQRIDIIRNRYNSGLLNDTIERKRNKLKNLLDTLEIPEVSPDYLHRAPTEADYEGGTLLAKRAAQNPLTAALQQEIESLEDYKKEVDSDYKNTLTKPEHMSKELTEFSNELAAENKRSNLDYKFNEIAENISKTNDINELDKIKLDPTLKDTHKDAFDAAIGKKRAELNKIKKEQEAGVKAQNQFADNVITEINNITYGGDPGMSLSDSASVDSATIQSSQEVDANNIEGEVFNDSEGYLFRSDEDNPSFTDGGQSYWESAEQRATREANEEIANELKNKEAQESQESKEGDVKSKKIDEEKGRTSENDGTPSEEETPEEVTSNDPVEYIFPEPTKLNTGTVEDITVPDDPDNLAEEEAIEGDVNENDIIANIDLNNTPEDVETKYSIQDGNIMVNFITRLPRLIFDQSQKVLNYLNNHRSKANDVYNIKVWTHNKNGYDNKFPAAQPGLRAYEKLRRFQKQGGEALTIEDYENLLYRLPLTATLSTDSDIQMSIDGLSQNNFEIVDGKVRMKKDASYGFINAFNIRLQIINALLQDVDTPISLKFAKQIKGKLNVNRDANGRSVMSDISEMAEFSKLSREDRIKAIQQSLAYVDTYRMVRGLANGETISGGAKTPGIIYVRLPNRDGSIQNIQVSRKKVSDDEGDSGVSTLDMLVMMMQDSSLEGNPYTMKFDDFIASMTNRENADMINERFEKVKAILNNHNPNYTVYDFFNFFYHTSSNNKTKLNFQEGRVYVGRLVEKLGMPSDVLSQYVKESPDGLLYMNSDALSTDEGANILKGYLNMLKQHVRADLANDPMYIEYLIDNVLMTDIKPEETFTLNFKGYERNNGRVIYHKGNRPLEPNVFVSNLVSTPNVDRVMKIPNEVIENMPPELRAITERVGLSTEVVNKPSNVGGGQATTTSVQSEIDKIENERMEIFRENYDKINEGKGNEVDYTYNDKQDQKLIDLANKSPEHAQAVLKQLEKQLRKDGDVYKSIEAGLAALEAQRSGGQEAPSQQSASQQTVSRTISLLESQPVPTHNTSSYTIVPATETTGNTEGIAVVPVTENNNQNTSNQSKVYKIGNSYYRISGDPTKGYVVKHAKTGRVLKSDDKTYKKVLVAHRPDLQEQIFPEKKKAAKKLKKFTAYSAAEYIKANGLTLENAVLIYFAIGGTVSRKGVQGNEKGRKWYEGKDGLKASATWETVAEDLRAEYADDYDFDEKALADEVENVMLSYSSKTELNEAIIDKANQLRDANEGVLSEEDVKDVIYHQGGHQLLSIYEAEDAEKNLSDEEKIDYYEQEYLKTLNSLPVEEQIKLYEEIDEATPVSEYDGRASSEVPSATESTENIPTTSEAIKQAATGTSESELSELEAFFNNADMSNKAKTLMTMMSMSNIKLTPTMMNVNNMDSTFRSLLENIKQGNKVSELLNKICTK